MSFFAFIIVIWLFYILTKDFFNSPKFTNFFEDRAYLEAKYLVALLAKVAKSDGHVNELEAELISQTLDDIALKLGGDRVKRAELKNIYNTQKENISNAYKIAREYNDKFRLSADEAVARMSFLLNLAYIDASLSDDERRVITQIAMGLRVNGNTLNALFARFDEFYKNRRRESFNQWQNANNQRDYQNSHYSGEGAYNQYSSYNQRSNSKPKPKSAAKSPYATLGLSEGAKFSEVKKRYRELVKKYHPDILMGRGESEEMIEKSTRKLQDINEAYELIKAKNQ